MQKFKEKIDTDKCIVCGKESDVIMKCCSLHGEIGMCRNHALMFCNSTRCICEVVEENMNIIERFRNFIRERIF